MAKKELSGLDLLALVRFNVTRMDIYGLRYKYGLDNITQEILIRYYENEDEVLNVVHWLGRVTRIVLMEFGRKVRRDNKNVPIDAFHKSDELHHKYHRVFILKGYSEHLFICILELSIKDRLLVTHYYILGKTYRELASEQNCTHVTIGNRIKKCLNQLKVCLEKRGVIKSGL